MPSVVSGKKPNIVHRSESLNSQVSDQNKRVSFNRDVSVKRIPRGYIDGKLVAIVDPAITIYPHDSDSQSPNSGLWINSNLAVLENGESDLEGIQECILREAKTVLEHVDNIECVSSPFSQTTLERINKKPQRSPSLINNLFSRTLPAERRLKRSQSQLHLKDSKLQTRLINKNNQNLNSILNLEPVNRISSSNTITSDWQKVGRIRKAPQNRTPLTEFSEAVLSFSEGSESSSSSKFQIEKGNGVMQFSSDSPLSSLSGPEEENMANATVYSPRVSSLVRNLSMKRDESHSGAPTFRSSFIEPGSNTHNNNQPFSYTGGSRSRSLETNGNSMSGKYSNRVPKEVIYARVVSGERNGNGRPGEKRTVHAKYTNGVSPTSSTGSSSGSNRIQHNVYNNTNNKENSWKTRELEEDNLRSSYKPYNGYDYDNSNKYKNNVTTVLLNSIDEDIPDFPSTTIHEDDIYRSYPNRDRSVSPVPKPERTFFYGDSRNPRSIAQKPGFDSNSSSPHFYSSSSREPSPINKAIPSAKLVRDIERKKDSVLPSAKLVSTYAPKTNHTNYKYMTAKLGYLPSDTSVIDEGSRRGKSVDSNYKYYEYQPSSRTKQTIASSGAQYEKRAALNRVSNNRKDSNSSAERKQNQKNLVESNYSIKNNKVVNTPNVTKTPNQPKHSSGGGIISTLMRRGKDKKVPKDKTDSLQTEHNSYEKTINGGHQVKKPRYRFLSFLDKSFSSKKASNEKEKQLEKQYSKPPLGKMITTDSEIEEAERRRDGEYHSWSSVDDVYRASARDRSSKGKTLTRGKSYNFGDYDKDSEKPWYDKYYDDNEDYRRNLSHKAHQQYSSHTLGKPRHPSGLNNIDENKISMQPYQSKSLDRRYLRSNTKNSIPPKIIVTPTSPPVDETANNKWEMDYKLYNTHGQHDSSNNYHKSLSHKTSGLSKSSNELGDFNNMHDREDCGPGDKLRYFGDTDMEDALNYQKHQRKNRQSSTLSRPRQDSYGEIENNNPQYTQRNGSHISRRDNTQFKKPKFHRTAGPSLSLNSSESENGSRLSKGSSHLGSQRSVYLHAAAVADIPPNTGLQNRTPSKDELSVHSGSQKQSHHLTRSMSVLAPWRPKNYREKYELNYNSDGLRDARNGRPPKPPRSPNTKSVSPAPNKSKRNTSTDSLLKREKLGRNSSQPQPDIKSATLGRPVKTTGSAISRSKSMPGNNRVAGWLLGRSRKSGTLGRVT